MLNAALFCPSSDSHMEHGRRVVVCVTRPNGFKYGRRRRVCMPTIMCIMYNVLMCILRANAQAE